MKPLAEVVADHVSSVLNTVSGAAVVMSVRAFRDPQERKAYQAGASDVLTATALALGLSAEFGPMLLGIPLTLQDGPQLSMTADQAPAWTKPLTLTARQREVAELIGHGLNNYDIALKLTVSFETVRAHRATVYLRTGSHSVTDLARWLKAHPASPEEIELRSQLEVPRES